MISTFLAISYGDKNKIVLFCPNNKQKKIKQVMKPNGKIQIHKK